MGRRRRVHARHGEGGLVQGQRGQHSVPRQRIASEL